MNQEDMDNCLKRSLLILACIVGVFVDSTAQIKYNYIVGPGNTTCDSLVLNQDDFSSKLEKIENARWRYSQSMHLNRPHGLRRADFYSCDVKTGYLVLLIDDQTSIYQNVPVDLWKEFTESPDPDRFIADKIKGTFDELK